MENNDTIKELTALITYLVNHNESHTKELEELGESLKKEGKLEAYNDVLNAVSDYRKGNEKLKSSLTKISK